MEVRKCVHMRKCMHSIVFIVRGDTGFVHSGVPIVWGRSDRSRDVPGSLDHSEHLRVCR